MPSSTVITPSLPTISIALAMSSPTLASPAEMEATCEMPSLFSTGLDIALIFSTAVSTAAAMPFLRIMGLAPAARFLSPSRMIACASSIAVVVPSPATSLVLVETSLTSCAPIFSNGSSSSISFAIVTPSLVIKGAPNFLSSTTFLPLGPRVILTVSAITFTPFSSAFLASSPYLICLAILVLLITQRLPECRSGGLWYILCRQPLLPFRCIWKGALYRRV